MPFCNAFAPLPNAVTLPPFEQSIPLCEHLEIVATLEDRTVQLLEVIAKLTLERVMGYV
jgi:hypothetical protein